MKRARFPSSRPRYRAARPASPVATLRATRPKTVRKLLFSDSVASASTVNADPANRSTSEPVGRLLADQVKAAGKSPDDLMLRSPSTLLFDQRNPAAGASHVV